MYVFIQSEPGLYTVGFYKPDGKFEPVDDYSKKQEAEKQVHYLNGGTTESEPKEKEETRQYNIVWAVRLQSTDKVAAAKKARSMMLNPDNNSTLFYVSPDDINIVPEGECHEIVDLKEW